MGHELETFAQRLLECPWLDCSTFLKIIDVLIERWMSENETGWIDRIRQLFDKSIVVYGASAVDFWIAFTHFEHRHGKGDLSRIYRRALNSGLKSLAPLEDCLRSLD